MLINLRPSGQPRLGAPALMHCAHAAERATGQRAVNAQALGSTEIYRDEDGDQPS